MKIGMDDVVAAETRLSDVDGMGGRLVIRGISLDDLVATSRYEDVAALLLSGLFEVQITACELKSLIGDARVSLFDHVAAVDAAVLALPPVEALRALLARVPDGADFETAVRLMAAPAALGEPYYRDVR